MLTQDNLQLLYRYSYTLTCNEQDAYDLLQHAIEKYLCSAKKPNNKIAFIKRVIKNKHIDNYRHNNIIQFDSYDDTVFPLDNDSCELENLIINEDMVENILLALNPDERELIFYWAYEGYTAQQISETLEIPRGTILSKLHRIKARLVQQFDINVNDSLEAKQ